MKTKDVLRKLKKRSKKRQLSHRDFLSTGSTLLNLAITDKPNWGFLIGKYHHIVGDSISGKTFLSLTCLAEASINSNFDNYRFIYDNAEDGALMDIKKFFGKEVFKRIEWPSLAIGCSRTVEEFYFHVDDAIKKDKPFIYILDSADSLSSQDETEKFDKTKKALRAGKDAAGSYGDGKAKKNSANLRRLLTPLRKSGSILIIISQTRDNLGFGFGGKTRSGGHALLFYSCTELWSSVRKKIEKIIKGKPRQLGIQCLIQVKKNRITGKERKITIPIYHSFGIDDIGSCIDYLISEGHWKAKGKNINAPEFNFIGQKRKLIRKIEDEGMEKDLREIVGDVWTEIEEACAVKRKKRYE